jgi:hypothetical protein
MIEDYREFLLWVYNSSYSDYKEIFAKGLVKWMSMMNLELYLSISHNLDLETLLELCYRNDLSVPGLYKKVSIDSSYLDYVQLSPIELTKLIIEFNNRGKE